MDIFLHGDDETLFAPSEDLDGFEAFFGRRTSRSELVLSSSPSVTDSGIDASSFETTFTDPESTTLTNETSEEGDGIGAMFNQLYESLTCCDEDDFDAFDSPKRLYNRKPSAQFGKSEQEMQTMELIVRKSKLSTSAAEFVPMPKSTQITKQVSGKYTMEFVMEYHKLVSSLKSTRPLQTQDCFATSTPLKSRQNRAINTPACLFCKRSGKSLDVIRSHSLRNPITKAIICPHKDEMCTACGPTDEDWMLHTTDQCVNSKRISIGNCGFMNFK